jgi:chromosome segregation ATPase
MKYGRSAGDEDLNLIKLELERHSSGEVAPSQLAHQIETIAAASRALETALIRERNYSKQLREYVNQVIMRMHSLQKQEQEASDKLKEIQTGRDTSAKQIQELGAELDKTRKELTQYRNAWGQILAREKHAQYILSRGEISAKRIQELELSLGTLEKRVAAEKSAREKAESHVSTHRQELQTALVRLHSSEARYNDMARELEAIHTLRKNHTLELSRVEQMAREKFEAQLLREREQIMTALMKEREEFSRTLAELERARMESEQSRERLRRDLETKFNAEVQRLKAQAEAQSQSQLAQAQLEREQATEQVKEALRGEITKLESIIRSLGDESKALRNELSQARSEVSGIEQSSRQAELELLRAREEIVLLQKQLLDEQRRAASGVESVSDSMRAEMERVQAEAQEAQSELERQRERTLRLNQDVCEMLQADRKLIQKHVERLLEAWGGEDPALSEALQALRDACEVRTVRSEAPAAKLEIVTTGGSRLNC